MVQRMKAAGCIVIGKTNTPEFGLGSHTFNEVFGVDAQRLRPAPSRPAAAAAAPRSRWRTRMLPVADGSDFMGSLRNPAAWNNVFGLRPSQGRVPRWPAHDVWVAQLGTEGPMGAHRARRRRCCSTCRPGYDPRVPLSLAASERVRRRRSTTFDARGVRIGWLGDLDGYLRDGARHPRICERACAARRRSAARSSRRALGFAPERGLGRVADAGGAGCVAARIAPHLADPANRALHQARGAVGARPGRSA